MDEEQQKNQQISELEECKKQADDYLNNWKRERADFINYKKDEAKRMEEFIKFANEAVILEVIEAMDDLEKAAGEMKNEGLYQVLRKFQELLKKYGAEKIKVEGEKFDPNFHESIFSESGEKMPDGVSFEGNIEEVRPGYTMHGKVIRPARVRFLASKIN